MNDVTKPVNCWSWNGYNSQWVEDGLTRKQVIKEMLRARRDKAFISATILKDDDEGFVVEVQRGFDFYGWRTSTDIFTTMSGIFEEDPEDNLQGVWALA